MKKSVLITGASRGIGRAAAVRFARERYSLTLIARERGDLLEALSQELSEKYHVSVQGFLGDAGNEEFIRETLSKAGVPEVLVNNAGISRVGLLTELSLAEWNEVLRVNLTSVFLFCKYAVPEMIRRQSGRIVNVSSVWGSVGASCEVAYSASKGGVEAFTKALAKELAPGGIAVNAIAPGCINTDMNADLSEEERLALMEEIPSGRFGEAEEAAELIYSLATGPAYLTGQVVGLTGGWMR